MEEDVKHLHFSLPCDRAQASWVPWKHLGSSGHFCPSVNHRVGWGRVKNALPLLPLQRLQQLSLPSKYSTLIYTNDLPGAEKGLSGDRAGGVNGQAQEGYSIGHVA